MFNEIFSTLYDTRTNVDVLIKQCHEILSDAANGIVMKGNQRIKNGPLDRATAQRIGHAEMNAVIDSLNAYLTTFSNGNVRISLDVDVLKENFMSEINRIGQ